VTEVLLGVAFGPKLLAVDLPQDMLRGLSAFGISALFLFAGLEVEVDELKHRRRALLQHLAIQIVLFVAATWVAVQLGLGLAGGVLVAVAVMTPSAGFIVSSLDALGLPEAITSWIKQKAIVTEVVAIATVLVFANTTSSRALALGLLGVAVLLAGVPLLFIAFHRVILPFAPRTEFSFMMIVALFAAYLTHHLGAHYLVGAFVVGFVARRYLDWAIGRGVEIGTVHAALSSFRFFSAFFVPFFFFQVGVHLPEDAFTLQAGAFTAALLVAAVPLRVGSVFVHRRIGLDEARADALSVGFLLGPTTVFSIAVAEILLHAKLAPGWVVGGLVLYGGATSFLPLVTRRVRSTEYEDIVIEIGEPTDRRLASLRPPNPEPRKGPAAADG
jgi:Kef-type K+ transport system membrane component KefB